MSEQTRRLQRRGMILLVIQVIKSTDVDMKSYITDTCTRSHTSHSFHNLCILNVVRAFDTRYEGRIQRLHVLFRHKHGSLLHPNDSRFCPHNGSNSDDSQLSWRYFRVSYYSNVVSQMGNFLSGFHFRVHSLEHVG